MADPATKAQIGVTGLAVMGSNLARNFARNGFVTAVHNRTDAKTAALSPSTARTGPSSRPHPRPISSPRWSRPRKIIIMVKAGGPTDAVIDELSELLEPGDILIDGGNAQFSDTIRREAALRDKGIHFVGCGVSGGEEGALNGPSIMPGGSKESYESLGPMLEKISAHVDGDPCCTHIGADGAGHFVKMVHNGIEYADMQLIAEAYDLLRRGAGMEPAEIAATFADWNTGELDSFLIEITADVLAHVDAETGAPFVDVMLDAAGMKGTGTWTVQTALDLGVPVSGIAEAVFARGLSSEAAQRAAAAGAARTGQSLAGQGPGRLHRGRQARAVRVQDRRVRPGLRRDRGRREGVRLGHRPGSAGPDLAGRLHHPGPVPQPDHRGVRRCRRGAAVAAARAVLHRGDHGAQSSWRRVVAGAAQSGIPTPGFAAALSYYDGLRSERLPAALIQAQRDFFGAHTYKRVDKDGVFHTLWSGDRSEIGA